MDISCIVTETIVDAKTNYIVGAHICSVFKTYQDAMWYLDNETTPSIQPSAVVDSYDPAADGAIKTYHVKENGRHVLYIYKIEQWIIRERYYTPTFLSEDE